MTKIIMHGCNGKMGQMISDIVAADENAQIVAGIDLVDNKENAYPVFTDITTCDIEADVMIDFTSAKALDSVLSYCKAKSLPLVLCSTGYSKEQIEQIRDAAREIPLLKSANMSLGINTVMKLLQVATPILAESGFDIEIVEKHHNQKLDAPSGTALALADTINEVMNEKYEYKYDRSQERAKRGQNEIGISAVRGGTIVGEHEVIFAGTDEVIEVKHTAYSRAVFAKGAVEAAKYMQGKKPGMYDMSDVIA